MRPPGSNGPRRCGRSEVDALGKPREFCPEEVGGGILSRAPYEVSRFPRSAEDAPAEVATFGRLGPGIGARWGMEREYGVVREPARLSGSRAVISPE